MEKTSTLVNNMYSNANEFVKFQTKSLKLEIYERITNVISSGLSAGVILIFGLFSFLFINFGLAYWLSDVLESRALGFLCIGGFYMLVLGIYLLLKDRLGKNKIKNLVLLKVSKTMNDYEALLEEQEIIHAKVDESALKFKANLEEVKQNIDTLKENFKSFKGNFVSEDTGDENTHVGPKVPRFAMTTIVDFLMQKVIFKNGGFIQKTILPIITNALLTSTVFKEDKKTSLLENLKMKLLKFF